MDAFALGLARWQFAITTIYHFFFVPLTLGLVWVLVVMEALYVAKGRDELRRMTKFWGKLFVINFAMGVVTGIVQEFQFGMNWSEYSRFVGDVFGAPLAIEALLAFFLESTFLGIWVFGWDRLPRKVHLACIGLVALASTLSALWILIANSFMQQPVGYALEGGRAVMTDFLALLTNPNVWLQFPHVMMSGLATGAFFVLGISAYHLLRRSQPEIFAPSFRVAAVVGLLPVLLIGVTGHAQAQHMVVIQPMKMAAAEGLFRTEDPASFSLLTIFDWSGRREVFAIRIPRLLSLLAYNRLSGEVRGIDDLQQEYAARYGPGDYVPPTWVAYWAFRVMVGVGLLMIVLAGYGLYLARGRRLETPPRLLKVFLYSIALPYVATTSGWLLTETGRFPWVVYGVMRIEEAVSPSVTAGMVATSLVVFTLVYGILMAAAIYLIAKYAKKGALGLEAVPEESAAASLLVGS